MECFRIVNGADIVARMPRHTNSAGAVLDYEHVGRTVLIDEAGEVADGFWVEGESADAVCPLRDVSPLTNPFGPNSVRSRHVAVRSAASCRHLGASRPHLGDVSATCRRRLGGISHSRGPKITARENREQTDNDNSRTAHWAPRGRRWLRRLTGGPGRRTRQRRL